MLRKDAQLAEKIYDLWTPVTRKEFASKLFDIDSKKGKNAMLEIKGKVNTAICYASVIEEEAIEQIYQRLAVDLNRGMELYNLC